MRTLLLAAALVATPGFVGANQAPEVEAIALCDDTELVARSNWTAESFEGVSLQLPPGFTVADLPTFTDHGGRSWTNGQITVSLTKGFFGVQSFALYRGTRCRVEVRKGPALLITGSRADGSLILAWDPALRTATFNNVSVEAWSTTSADLALLRTIVLSAQPMR